MADHDSGHFHITSATKPVKPLPVALQGRKRWLLLGSGGCGLFLFIVALIIGGFVISGRSDNSAQADTDSNIATPQQAMPIIAPSEEANSSATTLSPVTPNVLTTETVEVKFTTQPSPTAQATLFGPICFKTTSNGTQTPDCGTTFPPAITEVHAIFDYTGMQPQHQEWTRIWYHNGQEVLKVKEKWTGDATGQFDYNLNTADSDPLSSGTWELELYVDGALQTYGAFEINPQTATPADTPEPAASPPLATPAQTYKLAFTQWDGSKHSVWISDLDGNNQRFLLDFAASPSWSPDGRNIAFYGEEGIDTQEAVSIGANGLWRMGPGGENPIRLIPEGTGHTVSWAANGDLIAFDAARGGPDRRIYFADPDGNPQPFEILGEQPSFAPDSIQVVAKVCRPECGLWITNYDDSNPRQLTMEGSDGLPAWSPDGTKIAFSRNVDGNVDIYTINIDGSDLQRLTTAPGNDSVPAWTPDSRQIVFRSTRNGLWQIFKMNADGSDQQLIIDNVGANDEWAFDRMSVK